MLLLLFLLSLPQVIAVTCEGGCSTSDAIGGSGCAVQSQGSCMMKIGTECIVLKNNTGKSHFIPAKEGKRDWETFKSTANRERFSFSACPVVVVSPPPTTPPITPTPTPSALMCWQGGPEAGRNDCTTAGACSALNATSRTKCKDSSRNNGETYEAYYTVVCRQTSALNHPDCVINGGGVGSEDCPDSTPTCESSAYFSINGANLVCSLGNCYDSGPYTLSTYLAGGSLQGYTSETYARAEADSKTQVTNNLISSGKQPSEYNFCTTASTLNCSAPGCEGGETGDVLISWAIPKAPASCGGTTTGGSTTGGYSCTETGWAPDPAATCSNETVAQTSNCGTTRTVSGTKSCAPTQSCWWNAEYTAPFMAPSSVGSPYECAGVERTCSTSNIGQKLNCIPGMGSDSVQKGNITCQCNGSAPKVATAAEIDSCAVSEGDACAPAGYDPGIVDNCGCKDGWSIAMICAADGTARFKKRTAPLGGTNNCL
jgi:hypothetical protein